MPPKIMDPPGVLSRPDGDRNEMEALTLASMQHLPTAVIFVMDLSGYSGLQSSLENQVRSILLCTIFACFLWKSSLFSFGRGSFFLALAAAGPAGVQRGQNGVRVGPGRVPWHMLQVVNVA